MTKEKQLYVSPETEALVIRFEGVIVLTRITTTMAQIFNCKGNEKDI